MTDSSGGAVATATSVAFATTLGTFPNGSTSYTVTTPDDSGSVVVSLISGVASGTAVVTVTSNSVTQTKNVEFEAQPISTIGSISVTPGSESITADGVSTTNITATVLDGSGNSIADGTVVSFVKNTAYGTLSATSATTSGGTASVILTSPTQAGYAAIIQAQAGGLMDVTQVNFIPGAAHKIQAVATPQAIPAVPDSPEDISRIEATVTDANNNYVVNGTEVTFSIGRGWIWDGYPFEGSFGSFSWVSSKTVSTGNGVAKIAVVGGNVVETGTVDICVGGLCYEDADGNPGRQVSYGGTIGEASGLPASVELTFSAPSIQVKGTGGTETANITARVYDETGNPITDSYTSGDGSTESGSAAFTSASAHFVTRGFSDGDTLTINSGADNGTYTIVSVDMDNERVILDQPMTATESVLNFTATVKNNITFSILLGPGGGENIDGKTAVPSTSTKSTVDGQASATLNSGTSPGGITIRVQCSQGTKTATATSSELGIESGPPANITLYKDTIVEDNEDGSISWIISAMVQDRYGNPVANDTALHFGLVDNQIEGLGFGYKEAGNDGEATAGDATFTSAGATFVTNGVVDGDSLIITAVGSKVRGGYIIETVDSERTVTLYKDMSFDDSNLDFYAGNAELGVVCGVVQTGNSEPDSLCTYTSSDGIKGVAHTRLTWGESAIWKPFYLYAESSGEGGHNLGKTFVNSYPAIAPVSIDVSIFPDTVTGATTGISVYAHLHDGATQGGVPHPHDIHDQILTFTTSNTSDTGFGPLATTTDITDLNGRATVSNLDTQNPAADTTATITVSVGSYSGSAILTVNKAP